VATRSGSDARLGEDGCSTDDREPLDGRHELGETERLHDLDHAHLDVVEAAEGSVPVRQGEARPLGGGWHLARHPARGTSGGKGPAKHAPAAPPCTETGKLPRHGAREGLLVHRSDHPGIGRDESTARSVAEPIGFVAAARSAGQ